MKAAYEPYAFPLERAHPEDAGLDIFSPLDYHILPFSSVIIPTGVHVELAPGTCGLIVSKSGLNIHHGITSTGLIDAGYDGEIIVNDNNEWECPACGNKDHAKMNVTRRTCGYLGENFWNVGKTKEIKARVLHL